MSNKAQHVFVGNVLHNGVGFQKGQLCPDDIHAEMLGKGLIHPLPQPVAPIPAPAVAEAPKSEAKIAEAKAKGSK